MTFTDEQLRATAAILHRIVTDAQVKLQWGAQKREELKVSLAKGENPVTYRSEWMRETKARIVEALLESSNSFNRTYKHDRISVQDMIDVLVYTIGTLAAKTKKSQGDLTSP